MSRDPERKAAAFPLSHQLQAAAIPPEGLRIKIRANDREREALARENGLVAVMDLEARLEVSRFGSEGLEVSGELHAKIVQTCVVTLEEFISTVEEPVHLRFAPRVDAESLQNHSSTRRSKGKDWRDEWERRVEEPQDDEAGARRIVDIDVDAPDPLIGGEIDLGAIVFEFLALSLDPYPRKPGAVFMEPENSDRDASPFAALRQITTKNRDQ